MYSFGTVVRFRHGILVKQHALSCVEASVEHDMPVARMGRHGRADGHVHGSQDGKAQPRAV